MDRSEAARELGVAPGSDAVAVEKAFRRAARTHHPDVGGDAARFHRALEARAVLLRPASQDPLVRALVVLYRYHPVVRLVEVVVRAADRRPAR